jgi:hypothetical protein
MGQETGAAYFRPDAASVAHLDRAGFVHDARAARRM